MQQKNARRSNQQRTEETRASLIAAARALFVEKSYAETGTPEVVKAAGVTRGALYHHFEDKADLLRAVVEAEARLVVEEIEQNAFAAPSVMEGLLSGASAYFDAMAVPGRTRLLLLDGPAVLGHEEMSRIDRETGGGSLRDGLAAVLPDLNLTPDVLDGLADVLSAAFDRAALGVAGGADRGSYENAISLILHALAETRGPGS